MIQANPVDISGLARAAVAGDEKALDLFSSGKRLFKNDITPF